MKRFLLFISLAAFSFFACNKSSSVPHSLKGKWRMILSTDNETSVATTKPSSIQGDVDITFIPSNSSEGAFDGNTPTNAFQGSYTIGLGEMINIQSVLITKVMETSWGMEFADNFPNAKSYSFDKGSLIIKAPNKTLVFEKL